MWRGFGCLGLFLLPFFAVGLWTLIHVAHATIVLNLGSVTTGYVIERVEVPAEHGTSFRLRYSFTVGGSEFRDFEPVEWDAYNRFPPGSAVDVKFLSWTASYQSILADGGVAPGSVRFMWIWVLIWDGALGGMTFYVLRRLANARRMIKHGVAAPATITGKRINAGAESLEYYVEYRFVAYDPAGMPDPITAREALSENESESVEVGDILTVLYLPEKPDENRLYRFSPIRAV